MKRTGRTHTRREDVRRAVAQLLIAALVTPAPALGAPSPPTPHGSGSGHGHPKPPVSCEDTLRSGAFPTVSTAQTELWPVNHSLVDVGLRVDVGTRCLGRATTRLAVYSNEPEDSNGDGSTIHDAQLDPPDLYLRAERRGGGDGRIYLVVATATYASVTGRACTAVVVPKSQSKKHRDAIRAQAKAIVQACEVNGPPTGLALLVDGPLDAANQAPTVNAGPDQGIDLGATAQLDGSAADDGQPTPASLSIAWSVVSGPGTVAFTSPAQARTEARFGAAGAYVSPADRERRRALGFRRCAGGRERGQRRTGRQCRPRCRRRAAEHHGHASGQRRG